MGDLQLALIGFGALLVALVWGYNFWQERKHRQRVARMLPADAPDVLMAGQTDPDVRREPDLAPAAVAREPTFAEVPEPGPQSPQSTEPASEASSQVAALPGEWADGIADCLLKIEFVDAVPVAEIWTAQAQWAAKIDKPMQWLGLDAKSARWRALLPQDPGSVTQLAVALQLVDRRGALGEATLAVFLGSLHQLAQRFAGLVELPEPAAVLARARELDQFCAAVDLQLELLVVPRQGSLNEMVGAKLKPVFATAGLRAEGDRFVAVDATGTELFALVCRSAAGNAVTDLAPASLSMIALGLDVPRVADGAAAFERMVAVGRQCGEVLGGQLADAHRKPLADETIAALRARIVDLQARLLARGIPAGGVRALRLFS